jgi:hypothetical protein
MAGSDDFVQGSVDGSGKKIDTTLLTWPDGTPKERQRIVFSDSDGLDSFARVTHVGQQLVRQDRFLETQYIAALDAQAALGSMRRERISPTDRRGSNGRGSTR